MPHEVDNEKELAHRCWAVVITSPEAQQAITGALDLGAQSETETAEIVIRNGKGSTVKVQAYKITNEVRKRLLKRQQDAPFKAVFYWKASTSEEPWIRWEMGKTVGRGPVSKLIRRGRIDLASTIITRNSRKPTK
jgi:hypothetical protein